MRSAVSSPCSCCAESARRGRSRRSRSRVRWPIATTPVRGSSGTPRHERARTQPNRAKGPRCGNARRRWVRSPPRQRVHGRREMDMQATRSRPHRSFRGCSPAFVYDPARSQPARERDRRVGSARARPRWNVPARSVLRAESALRRAAPVPSESRLLSRPTGLPSSSACVRSSWPLDNAAAPCARSRDGIRPC